MSAISDFFDFIEFVDYCTRSKKAGVRRYLRDYSDPFTKYSVREFHARYRFTPDALKNLVLPLIAPDLQKPSKRGLPFVPEIKLLITLRYFVTGNFQKTTEDVMTICRASASRIIIQTSKVLASKMRDIIKFPSTAEEMSTIKQKFYEIDNFPEVIGCLGCTHIKIKSPSGRMSEAYLNKNGWYSINVQAVTGPNMEFYYLVAQWPGSITDNFIYNSSTIKQRLKTGTLDGILLGDSGYEVSNELLTPFPSPTSPGQEAYNKSLNITRNTMERCFHIWKTRFSCLQVGMGKNIDTILDVICACAVLHNLTIQVNELDLLYCGYNIHDNVEVTPVTEDPNSSGYSARQALVERFFY